MGKKGSELHDLTLIFLFDTDRAVQVTEGVKDEEGRLKKFWLPKSQVECEVKWLEMEPGKTYTFTIPEWLVNEKGLTV